MSILLHCPNGPNSSGLDASIKNSFNRIQKQALNLGLPDLPPRVLFVTYNNQPELNYQEQCFSEFQGKQFYAVAKDESDWTWFCKIGPVLKLLISKRDQFDFVFAFDGTDTVFIENPKMVLERFDKLNCDLVFCPTNTDWPPVSEYRKFELSLAKKSSHPFLSAGGYFGKMGFVIKCLEEITKFYKAKDKTVFRNPVLLYPGKSAPLRKQIGSVFSYLNRFQKPKPFDDQLAWRSIHKRYWPRVKIDSQNFIFSRYDAFYNH